MRFPSAFLKTHIPKKLRQQILVQVGESIFLFSLV